MSLYFSPHLVSTHAVTVKKADFLVLLSSHVVHTLVGLNISDLQAGIRIEKKYKLLKLEI